jgi:hypothetical protein
LEAAAIPNPPPLDPPTYMPLESSDSVASLAVNRDRWCAIHSCDPAPTRLQHQPTFGLYHRYKGRESKKNNKTTPSHLHLSKRGFLDGTLTHGSTSTVTRRHRIRHHNTATDPPKLERAPDTPPHRPSHQPKLPWTHVARWPILERRKI